MYTVERKDGTSKKGKPYSVLVIKVHGVEIGQLFLEEKDVKLLELMAADVTKSKKRL